MKDLVKRIDSEPRFEVLQDFIKEIDPLESALIKWKFIQTALKSNTWQHIFYGSITYYSKVPGIEKVCLDFDVSGDNCKLCYLYVKNSCELCPLRPFSGTNCSIVWNSWSHDQEPMLKAIKQALKVEKKKPKEVFKRNLKLLNEKLNSIEGKSI